MIYSFWKNIYKFPRFLIAILLGFFLITLKPIFRLLKNKNNVIIAIVGIITILIALYLIIIKMTGII
uniref:Uncharacterized protein ycf33 n=1 Tax=Nitophyllum punctatum TaxID=158729 RepID=A0A4D6WWA8_9FLOR|nr:hypothetical protein [Nitophyllum punctatum]